MNKGHILEMRLNHIWTQADGGHCWACHDRRFGRQLEIVPQVNGKDSHPIMVLCQSCGNVMEDGSKE